MAPLNEAVKVHAGPQISGSRDRTIIYEGVLDPAWNIGKRAIPFDSVPCGGYSLALILESCIQHQSKTAHVDPLHISSHFLKPTTSQAPFSIRVQTLKVGKSISNLTAEFSQEGILRITAHAMFGVNGPTPEIDDGQHFTLQAPSPYARRIPVHSHPSETKRSPLFGAWRKNENVVWAFDTKTLAKNRPDHPNRTCNGTVGGGGTEWAAWYQFQQPTERLSNVYIPLLVDMFMNTTSLLPKEVGSEESAIWAPTMTLAVDFKYPIRELKEYHSQRTVGLYSSGRFINHPQRRHDIYVEVWSAPSQIGEGIPDEGWREKQICLAISTQMALTLPMAVNLRNGTKKSQPKL